MAALAVALVLTSCGADSGSAHYAARDLTTGAEVSTDSLAGRPAVLVSWTTWCRECDEELAGLAAFASSPAAQGLGIVAVNLDAGDVGDEIQAKIDKHGLTTTLWRDRRNEFKRVFGALGVPTTVLLDAEGSVAGVFPGAVDFEDEAILDAIDELRHPGSG